MRQIKASIEQNGLVDGIRYRNMTYRHRYLSNISDW